MEAKAHMCFYDGLGYILMHTVWVSAIAGFQWHWLWIVSFFSLVGIPVSQARCTCSEEEKRETLEAVRELERKKKQREMSGEESFGSAVLTRVVLPMAAGTFLYDRRSKKNGRRR